MTFTPWLLGVLLLLAGSSRGSLGAQPNAAKAAPASDRCLLIVETSKAMQRRSDAVLGAVRGLLMSGLNDQLRDGSTLGVWTYNEDLYAGRFPLQTWSSSAREDITQRTLSFLKRQKYEKQANFHKVAPALGGVIKDSELITVVLISSGDHEVRGTPFDDRINAAYRRWGDQQQKARMPFVTVFCARKGQIADYVVNTPPWPVEMPRLPPETNITEVVQAKLVEAVRKAQTSSVPPLIVSGKKPRPEQASTPKPEPPIAKPEAPPPVTAVTNEPVAVKPPDKTSPPAELAKAEPAPVGPAKPAVEASPKPGPAPVEVPNPKAGEVKALEPKPVESTPAKSEAAPPPPAPKPAPEPSAVLPVNTQPVPATPVTNGAAPAAVPSLTGAQRATSSPATGAPAPSARPAPGAQTATATPASSLVRGRNMGVGVIVFVVVVGLLLWRRSRAARGTSLITRSFERKNNP